MLKVIGEAGSGKTKKLLQYCANNNFTMVCRNTKEMIEKSEDYGIYNVDIISYIDYLQASEKEQKYVLDDMDEFLGVMGCSNLCAYGMNRGNE